MSIGTQKQLKTRSQEAHDLVNYTLSHLLDLIWCIWSGLYKHGGHFSVKLAMPTRNIYASLLPQESELVTVAVKGVQLQEQCFYFALFSVICSTTGANDANINCEALLSNCSCWWNFNAHYFTTVQGFYNVGALMHMLNNKNNMN